MRRPDAPSREVLAAYASIGSPRARLHTTIRWWTCPIAPLDPLLPTEGDFLEIGCGHGLVSAYLATRAPERRVTGVDIDAAKIELGRQAVRVAGLADRVQLDAVDTSWTPEPASVDAVLIVDVLYLLGLDGAVRLVEAAAAALRPGGVLVVKEMAETPRWKHRFATFQELLAVRVVGLTAGDQVDLVPLDALAAAMTGAGLTTDVRRLDRGYPHPHAVVVGRRPEL